MPEIHVTCEELRSRANDIERSAASAGDADRVEAGRLEAQLDAGVFDDDQDAADEARDEADRLLARSGEAVEERLLEAAALREQAANRECL